MQVEVVGVKFKSSNNTYSFSPNGLELKKGDSVLVESERGNDIGIIATEVHKVDVSSLVDSLKNVLRIAGKDEVKQAKEYEKMANTYLPEIKQMAKSLNLEMKILSVESNYDFSRLTINFTAEDRVDFRAFAKKLAEKYKKKVELRQVGPRDATRILGGLGICGKECCCSQGLGYCDHVSIKMAKNQSLSLNPNSISGVCGKLLCCLQYENENYVEMLKQMPKVNSFVDTPDGRGKVVYNDLFKKIVSVRFERDSVSEIKDFEVEKIKFDKNDKA